MQPVGVTASTIHAVDSNFRRLHRIRQRSDMQVLVAGPLSTGRRLRGESGFGDETGRSPPNAHTFHPQMRHKADKSVVCKHWLRGLCKKGEDCEFLHEYNLKKMPECWFFTKYGECSNPECMYLHIDPNSKVKECAWYNRGFCKHGKLWNVALRNGTPCGC